MLSDFIEWKIPGEDEEVMQWEVVKVATQLV